MRTPLAFSTFIVALHVSTPAMADKKACAQAHAEAQRSIRATTLLRARDQLTTCSRDECMTAIRKDCVAWLGEVNAAIPSIVVEAKGADGKETFDVRVSASDVVIAEKLSIKAIEFDPGTYALRFEHAGATVEKEIVLRPGKKNKTVEVSFEKSPIASTAPAPSGRERDASHAPAQQGTKSPVPWILGGVGVALVGVGGFFWLSAEGSRSDLESSNCAPNCDRGAVDDIKTQRLVGDILAIGGVVAIGAAVIWLVMDSSAPPANGGAKWMRALGTGALPF